MESDCAGRCIDCASGAETVHAERRDAHVRGGRQSHGARRLAADADADAALPARLQRGPPPVALAPQFRLVDGRSGANFKMERPA